MNHTDFRCHGAQTSLLYSQAVSGLATCSAGKLQSSPDPRCTAKRGYSRRDAMWGDDRMQILRPNHRGAETGPVGHECVGRAVVQANHAAVARTQTFHCPRAFSSLHSGPIQCCPVPADDFRAGWTGSAVSHAFINFGEPNGNMARSYYASRAIS